MSRTTTVTPVFLSFHEQANAPSPGEESTVLVEQFNSTPRTYPASPGNDSGIQLRVGPGCLRERQVAGPIIVKTDTRLLVESVGSWFLVSKVVDCQPSGSKFDAPLEFYFRVGEELGEQGDGEAESCMEHEQLDEYRDIIQNTYKVRNVVGGLLLRLCSILRREYNAWWISAAPIVGNVNEV